MNYQNILVPTDFSDNSVQALEFACMLVKLNHSKLHLLHIVENSSFSFRTENLYFDVNPNQSRFLDAEEEMRRFISKVSFKGITLTESIHAGKPHEQIINYALKENIDLIIIASHGWTGLSHLITGGVANKVLRYSEIPTICIKANNIAMQKEANSFKTTFAENWVG